MMSVFILTWGVMTYKGKLYDAQLKAQSHARGCAWLISAGACDVIPPQCSASGMGDLESSQGEELSEQANGATNGDTRGGPVQDELNSQIKGFFKKRIFASSTRSVERPKLIGGETTNIRGHYTLPCNTKPKTVGDIAKDIWENSFGKDK